MPRALRRVAAAVFSVLAAAPALAQECRGWVSPPGLVSLRGTVRAMTPWDPDGPGPEPMGMVVAGDFRLAQGELSTQHVAFWDGSAWRSLGEQPNAPVNALAVHDGELYAGGEFTSIGLIGVPRVARWTANGWESASDPSFTPLQGPVFALCSFQGELYAGGTPSLMGSFNSTSLARLSASGWWSRVGSINWPVRALAEHGGKLIVGGEFQTISGAGHAYVAAWDGDAWSALGAGLASAARALHVHAGVLYAAGDFGVHAWNGAAWTYAGCCPMGPVHALGSHGGSLVAAASGGSSIWSVSRLKDGVWSPLGVRGDGPGVLALGELNGDLLAGGSFWGAGGTRMFNLARWDGAAWRPMVRDFESRVTGAISTPRGLFVATDTPAFDGVNTTRNVVHWDGATWTPFTSPSAGVAIGDQCLAFYNDELIIGSAPSFLLAGAPKLARWDGAAWQPLGGQPEDSQSNYAIISAMLVHNGELVVGGRFDSVAGVPAQNIASWNGTRWKALGSGFDAPVLALESHGGALIAGGYFTQAGAVPASRVARWDGTAWQPMGAGFPGAVHALGRFAGDLIAGGEFWSIGGVEHRNVARWDGAAWRPIGPGPGEPYNPPVVAFAEWGGDLYASKLGSFGSGLYRWDGAAWSAVAGEPLRDVYTLCVHEGALWAGGQFERAGQEAHARHLAIWTGDKPRASAMMRSAHTSLGQGAILSVQGRGADPLSYRWHRGETPLDDGPTGGGSVLSGAGSPVLTISHARRADEGAYRCVVTTGCGSAASAVIGVTVECPADFDGSGGAPAVADIFAFLRAWFVGDFRTDFDGTEEIGVADIFAFLRAWFAGC